MAGRYPSGHTPEKKGMTMKNHTAADKDRLYLGVDVGGTKVQASLVRESGGILQPERQPTPRTGGPEQVLAVIEKVIDDALSKGKVAAADLTAVGIAVPGVVDPDTARVVVTPNMSLTGVAIGAAPGGPLPRAGGRGQRRQPGHAGRNLAGLGPPGPQRAGHLGGHGHRRRACAKGKLWRGARESAGEIGHIVMQIGGPKCGCGNRGCLEALASRTAIERDIRAGHGRRPDQHSHRAGRRRPERHPQRRHPPRLEAEDPLVTEVVRHASEVLGYACLTVRHLVTPRSSCWAAGVVEACSDFMMPIIENIVGSDRLPGARDGGQVLLSALGDDAVVLGAVALARKLVGRSPFKKRYAVSPRYPEIVRASVGEITVGRKTYRRDMYIPVNGKTKRRGKSLCHEHDGVPHTIRPKELQKVCRGGPEILIIGGGKEGTDRAERRVAAVPEPAGDSLRGLADRRRRWKPTTGRSSGRPP